MPPDIHWIASAEDCLYRWSAVRLDFLCVAVFFESKEVFNEDCICRIEIFSVRGTGTGYAADGGKCRKKGTPCRDSYLEVGG